MISWISIFFHYCLNNVSKSWISIQAQLSSAQISSFSKPILMVFLQAEACLQRAVRFRGFALENKLHFRVHGALERVREEAEAEMAKAKKNSRPSANKNVVILPPQLIQIELSLTKLSLSQPPGEKRAILAIVNFQYDIPERKLRMVLENLNFFCNQPSIKFRDDLLN